MFHQRPSSFSPNVAALESRLRALEKEIERMGRRAGRRASAELATAGDHLGDAIASAANEIVERFRSGGRLAGDEALRISGDAARFGATFGNRALRRVSDEIEYRPLTALAVAVGVGILIGMTTGARGRD